MTSALIVFYIFIAIALIILVLLQDPKGGGGAFFGGGGGSQSLFGATGATSFIVKATRFIAVLFALCVITLNFMLMRNKSATHMDTGVELSQPVLGGAAAEKTDEAPVKASNDKSEAAEETQNDSE